MQLYNLFLLDKIPVNQPHFVIILIINFIIPNYQQISDFLRKVMKQKFFTSYTKYALYTDD